MELSEMIQIAVKTLRDGGVIIYPTDTVWGIGCDSTNPKAVEKIYNIKERSENRAMIALMDSSDMIYDYVEDPPEIALQLIEITDKPLTIIFSDAINFAENLISQDGSIAIRVADHDFCRSLISKFKKPIVSTSANISGEQSPIKLSDISPKILNAADLIIEEKFEGTPTRKASSIIKIGSNGEVKIIRS